MHRHQYIEMRLAELDERMGSWLSLARRYKRTPAELPALLARLPQGIAANATTFNTSSDNQELFHHV